MVMQIDFIPVYSLQWGVLAKFLKPILLGYGILLAIIAFRLVLAPLRPMIPNVSPL